MTRKKTKDKYIIAILYTADCCDETHLFLEAVEARSASKALDWGCAQLADLNPTITDEVWLKLTSNRVKTKSGKFKFLEVT